jgi:hypothetical protein
VIARLQIDRVGLEPPSLESSPGQRVPQEVQQSARHIQYSVQRITNYKEVELGVLARKQITTIHISCRCNRRRKKEEGRRKKEEGVDAAVPPPLYYLL